MSERPHQASRLRHWPWLVLALATIPALWYVVDYEDDIDPELPGIVRPTFSRYPPPAYRFAEACDTIDHAAVYVSSAALVLAAWGTLRNQGEPHVARGGGVSAAGFWHAATPGPLADGWYGLGWRTILDPRARPPTGSSSCGLAAGVVAIVVLGLLATAFSVGLDRSSIARNPRAADRGRITDGHAASRLAGLGTDRLLASLVLRLGPVCLGVRLGQGRTGRSARLVPRRDRRGDGAGFPRPRLRRPRSCSGTSARFVGCEKWSRAASTSAPCRPYRG